MWRKQNKRIYKTEYILRQFSRYVIEPNPRILFSNFSFLFTTCLNTVFLLRIPIFLNRPMQIWCYQNKKYFTAHSISFFILPSILFFFICLWHRLNARTYHETDMFAVARHWNNEKNDIRNGKVFRLNKKMNTQVSACMWLKTAKLLSFAILLVYDEQLPFIYCEYRL